ncbi:hypothetical protein SEUBUCD646_0M03440 [Saccharomyces eubayanus]|uniref:Uncharacterized protein n=2 Tax=Saccharomyces TaxID=4930 RepID=A0A6C1EFF2_SACPS|nr:hypothetical protein GRS66_010017 [Saccharomyces pastorianus]CAI1647525.1 hypothetical protein SEUBUCD650_0M03380 [Saccharomyces eubayanus]CAI1677105.1 hypothetical protein SEUBUCD646_0M03440 [Saccharomyces eubayanus]
MLSTSSNRPISAHLTIHYKPIQEEEEEKRSGARGSSRHDDCFVEGDRSLTPNRKHEFIKTVLNINDDDSEFSDPCSPFTGSQDATSGTNLFGDFLSKRQQTLSNSMNIHDLYQCVHNLSPSAAANTNHQFIARRFSDSHIPSLHHRQQQTTTSKNFVQSTKNIQRIASYAADSDQRVKYLPNYHQSAPSTASSAATSRAAKPRKLPDDDNTKYVLQLQLSSSPHSQPASPPLQPDRRPSCSSFTCSSSSSSSACSSMSVSDPNNVTAYETNSARPQFPCGQPLDISSPCTRHHHRRNSIAVKFDKALYKKQQNSD